MSFKNEDGRTSNSEYYLSKGDIKDYNVMINDKNFSDQPIKIMILKHEKMLKKVATGQGDDYATGCLLDYPYFKENYKMRTIHLSKQQALDADSTN